MNIRKIKTHIKQRKSSSIIHSIIYGLFSILWQIITTSFVVLIIVGLLFVSLDNPSNHRTEIFGANSYENETILHALNNTDTNVVNRIESITVTDDRNQIATICGISSTESLMGCADNSFTNGRLSSSRIYVASNAAHVGFVDSFEHTLYHEIGHVVDAYNNGDYGVQSESYAENYAIQMENGKLH